LKGGLAGLKPAADACRACALGALHPSALLRLDPADRDAAHAQWLDDLRVAARG